MADEFLTRIDELSKHMTGDVRPVERIVDDFSLCGPMKRVESLQLLDEHLRTLDSDGVPSGEAALRSYARLTRLKREVDRTHQNLLRINR